MIYVEYVDIESFAVLDTTECRTKPTGTGPRGKHSTGACVCLGSRKWSVVSLDEWSSGGNDAVTVWVRKREKAMNENKQDDSSTPEQQSDKAPEVVYAELAIMPVARFVCVCGANGEVREPQTIQKMAAGKPLEIVCRNCHARVNVERPRLVSLGVGREASDWKKAALPLRKVNGG